MDRWVNRWMGGWMGGWQIFCSFQGLESHTQCVRDMTKRGFTSHTECVKGTCLFTLQGQSSKPRAAAMSGTTCHVSLLSSCPPCSSGVFPSAPGRTADYGCNPHSLHLAFCLRAPGKQTLIRSSDCHVLLGSGGSLFFPPLLSESPSPLLSSPWPCQPWHQRLDTE